MAMIAIPLSPDTSRLFREIEVDAHRDSSDHITIFYLGDDVDTNKLFDIIPIIYEAVKDVKPFEATCNRISTFPKGQKGYPVIAELKCDPLIELRNKLKKMLDKNKIDYDTTHEDYRPHTTLGYAKKKPKNIKLPTKAKLPINQIALYGGDRADSRLFVNFPFSLGVEKKAADKLIELANAFYEMTSKE
jgi:2'-5' RNA ligase